MSPKSEFSNSTKSTKSYCSQNLTNSTTLPKSYFSTTTKSPKPRCPQNLTSSATLSKSYFLPTSNSNLLCNLTNPNHSKMLSNSNNSENASNSCLSENYTNFNDCQNSSSIQIHSQNPNDLLSIFSTPTIFTSSKSSNLKPGPISPIRSNFSNTNTEFIFSNINPSQNLTILGKIHGKVLSFLIDSGSNISLLKSEKCELQPDELKTELLQIYGINPNFPISCQRSANLNLNLHKEFVIPTKFFLIDNLKTPFDGILGLNFLTLNNCFLNFSRSILTLNLSTFELNIPFTPISANNPPKEKPGEEINTQNPDYVEKKTIERKNDLQSKISRCLL